MSNHLSEKQNLFIYNNSLPNRLKNNKYENKYFIFYKLLSLYEKYKNCLMITKNETKNISLFDKTIKNIYYNKITLSQRVQNYIKIGKSTEKYIRKRLIFDVR